MSKQLYEEALADVKKVKEVAEANAQRAVLEAVAPRIRDLIERELLKESDEEADEAVSAPGSRAHKGSLMTDDPNKATDSESDQTDVDHDGEYEINLESVEMLSPVLKVAKLNAVRKVESFLTEIASSVDKCRSSSVSLRAVEEAVSNVESAYQYVQESIDDPGKKGAYELKLESFYKELTKIQESIMFQKTRRLVNEEDVTLKLTGLPDDIDLESVGVDLITGSEESPEGDEDEELELDLSDESGDESEEGSDDSDDSDESGESDEESSDELDLDLGEALRLSDDTVVEIDEGMLRREISRMRKLREEKDKSAKGAKMTAKELDDFGGGESAGCALSEQDDDDLDEQQDQLDEVDSMDDDDDLDEQQDQLDEADIEEMWKNEVEMSQVGDRRERDDFDASATSVPSKDKGNPAHRAHNESLKRHLKVNENVQERSKKRASRIRSLIAEAKRAGDVRRIQFLKQRYTQVAKVYNESVVKSNKLRALLSETKSTNVRSNVNRRPGQPAAETAVKTLRNKLAETNLINAKLLFTNKLLQNESLTARQKAQVIEQLDSAKTVREAKLVYESLAKTLTASTKSVNESKEARVIGSASRATRPSSTQTLSEGYEAERWAKLAGILK